MVENLRKVLHDKDRKLNGKKKKGTLKREVFVQVLEKHFPFKTANDIKSLRSALQYDQPLPVIGIERIFEETGDGDQG
eukprot:SAG11_NODE_21195_length_430_cov_0.613293_1_plen_77_part_10